MTRERKYAANLLIGFIVLLGIIAAFWFTRTSSTNDIYLIPEGYEGDIQVNYNVPGAPALQKEGKYDVIPISEDGTYETSKPDMEYGTVTDLYYYISHDGDRIAIDASCVHVKGNGSSQIGSSITRHNDLKITRTRCSEDFRAWGR